MVCCFSKMWEEVVLWHSPSQWEIDWMETVQGQFGWAVEARELERIGASFIDVFRCFQLTN